MMAYENEIHLRSGASSITLTTDGTQLLVGGLPIAGGLPLGSALAQPMTSGLWFNPNSSGSTGGSGAADRALAIPVLFAAPCTLNGIAINVSTGGDAGGVNRFGIYNDANGIPGSRLADLGTVAADTINTTPLVINQPVAATWYWFFVCTQLQPTTRCAWFSPTLTPVPTRIGAASPGSASNTVAYFYNSFASGALPASAGAANGSANLTSVPSIWLKAA